MKPLLQLLTLLSSFLGFVYWLFRKAPYELPKEPFPLHWRKILRKKVAFYKRLSGTEKARFEALVQTFLLNCRVIGAGIKVDDTDKILVGASAVIPVFGFPNWQMYPNIDEVLLYPGTFNGRTFATDGSDRNVLGMVGTGEMNRKMILSKPALHQGFASSGRSNVGIHEFVHLLDMLDGSVDGLPDNLLDKQYTVPWLHLMHEEMENIRDKDSDLRAYGATNEAEFLAVAAEYFFQRPHQLERKHPKLYRLLEVVFNQDLDGDGIGN